MPENSATAVAHPNIAFIKYWGNRDEGLRLPMNGSISMNLAGLETRTRVEFSSNLSADQLTLNGRSITGPGLDRVSRFLSQVRGLANQQVFARVESQNNFPIGAGIASSAAAFAALSLAAASAIGLHLNEAQLSRLARLGSGSASRSIPSGYVEWLVGNDDTSSHAVSLAPADHWALVDCVAIVSSGHKKVGSTAGHALAPTSPLQTARVEDAPRRLDLCRHAIINKDFTALAEVVEQDSTLMHAVMMTSTPPLFYWEPASLALMKAIPSWRAQGLPVFFTLDAGPNVHVICPSDYSAEVRSRLMSISGVQDVLIASAGGPAHLE